MKQSGLLPRICTRVLLRRLQPTDLADFQAYRTDPEVARYQGWDTMPDEKAAGFLTHMSDAVLLERGEWSQIGIALRETDALIGDIGIHVSEDGTEAEVGFSLNRSRQGQGLAKEAVEAAIAMLFDATGVQKIVGITDARNEPSIRLLQRLGMQQTATLDTTFQGEPCIEYVFELPRQDTS